MDRLGNRLSEAVKNKNWEEVLALLRFGPPFLTRDRIALLRGQAWQALGHDEAAMLFFDYASKLNPDNAHAQVLQLRTLLKLGRFDEARERAEVFATVSAASLRCSFSAAS